jgi:hypothetical protein
VNPRILWPPPTPEGTWSLLSTFLTRRQLMAWSGFLLPSAAVAHLPLAERAAARVVPGLTYEQIRTMQRRGLFDAFRPKLGRDGVPMVQWTARRRGDTWLYTPHDVLMCRLAAWMLARGLSMQRIAYVLRVEDARATMLAPNAGTLFVWSYGREFRGLVLGPDEERRVDEAFAGVPAMRFSLAFVGGRAFEQRVQRAWLRQRVTRWNQDWSPAALLAEQQRRVAPAREGNTT